MNRRIGILIPTWFFAGWDTDIHKIRVRDVIRFNSCILVGAWQEFESNHFCIILMHSEFDVVPEGMRTPVYSLEDARRIFPYLFSDTNPILYRRW